MAKILDLPLAGALTGTETVVLVQGGATRKVAMDTITAQVRAPIAAELDSAASAYGTWLQLAGNTGRTKLEFIASLGPTIVAATKPELDANLSMPAGSKAEVISDATLALRGIYRKDGAAGVGAWTKVGDLGLAEVGSRLGTIENRMRAVPLDRQARVLFTDAADNILIDITADRILHPDIDALKATTAGFAAAGSAIQRQIGRARVVFTDAADNFMLAFDEKRIFHPDITSIEQRADRGVRSALLARTRLPASNLDLVSRLFMLLMFGQSNALGVADPAKLPEPGVWAKMFNGGVNSRGGFDSGATGSETGARRTSFVAAFEQDNETGAVAWANMLLQLLHDEDGIDLASSGLIALLSGQGVGGQNIAQLANNYFFRVQEDCVSAKALADAAGLSFGSAVALYDGNESNQLGSTTDQPGAGTFLSALRSMQVAIQAAVNGASGLALPVPMLLAQTNSHLATTSASYNNPAAWVARAQLAAAVNADGSNPHIHLTGPTYQLTYQDAVHLAAIGQLMKRCTQAIYAKRLFFDGVKPALMVPTLRRAGDYLRLRFPLDPGRQLVVDTATVPAQPNFGLRLFDGTGAPVGFTAALAGFDTIELRPAATPQLGWTCDYALASNVAGGTVGLGNLRDNQGDVITARFIGRRCDNWVPLFKIGVIA